MTTSTGQALKEWDAQVKALLGGRHVLLVRKGGIIEPRGGFEVEHRELLLYPTFLHQNPGELRPEHQDLLRDDPRPGSVSLEALATVERVWKIQDERLARALEPHQALTADAISRRFAYRGRPWVHALLLRVSALPGPAVLPETPAYAGCVSWVPLEQAVSVAGAMPVLGDGAFVEQRLELEALLG